MKRIAIGLQYDGTAWHGYQKQEDGQTVQDKLEQALEKFATVRLGTTCAGRTDKPLCKAARAAAKGAR